MFYKDLAREHQKIVENSTATKDGRVSKGMQNQISQALKTSKTSLNDPNRKQIFEKLSEKIKQNYDFSDGELEVILEKGFERFLKNQLTVGSGYTQNLDEIFFVAVVRMSLVAKKYSFSKKKFAKIIDNLSYYDATKIENLFLEYKNDDFVNTRIIKRFVIINPLNPQQAIEKAKIIYEELVQYYENNNFIDKRIIKHFIIHNPNDPKRSIENAITTENKLIKYYENDNFIDKGIIRRFIISNPTDPKGAIEKAREKIILLFKKLENGEFTDKRITKKFIQFAVSRFPNSSDPIGDYFKIYPGNK